MRLAVLALAAASSCNGGKPAPSPVPTIPPVVVTAGPVHAEAGTECGLACERRHSEGCPSGHAMKSLDHCVASCVDARQNVSNQTADDWALTFTCGERPSQ